MRPPRESSLGFGTIKASFRRCSDLLPEVSPVFDRTEATLGDIFPTYASLSEVSLEIRPPREFSLGFGTIKASIRRCTKLPPGVSPFFFRSLPRALPPMSSLAGSLSPSCLSGRLLIVVVATRFTRMPAGCVTGVVQGRETYYYVVCRFSMQTKTLTHLIAKGMVKELRWRRGRNFLRYVKDGSRGVCSSNVRHLVQKLVSAAQIQLWQKLVSFSGIS